MARNPLAKIRNPDCELCPLNEDAETVCLMGSGPFKAKVMVVGEAPGEREDEEEEVFIGRAGKLLDDLLLDAGLDRDDCYVTNVAKCRPPENRQPTRREIRLCTSTYLTKEVEVVKPDFILPLGNAALQGVLGKSGITKHRGTKFTAHGATVFPTFHPAAVLRNPRYLEAVEADLKRFGQIVRGEARSPETKVTLVDTPAKVKGLIEHLNRADAWSYDIETNTLNEHADNAAIICIGFTWRRGHAAVVPLWHNETPWRNPQQVLDVLAPCFQNRARHIAHNGKFDARFLARFGVPVRQDFDTMLAAHMLDENRRKALESLAQLILGADAYDVGRELKAGEGAEIPFAELAKYNGKDCDYTFRLRTIFRRQLKEEPRSARIFAFLMMPAANALVDIEQNGVQVDWERWVERGGEVERKCNVLDGAMRKRIPEDKREEFNFNSPQQIARWLFEDLGLPSLRETRTGRDSTDRSVLHQLKRQSKEVQALLKYRKLDKYRTTYIGPWADHVDKNYRMHPSYKLFGTVTGRLSAENPNLQQTPRDKMIRSIIGARRGYLLVEADYSQIELRIAAMLAHERNMLRTFLAGEDIHKNTAMGITGRAPDKITGEERSLAKPVNFGFVYGMGARKFVTYARDEYDLEISEEDAERFRRKFFATYPALRAWHERQRRLVHRYHRVTSPLGRTRHLPDILSGDSGIVSEAERQAINSPVQSTASDLMLIALVKLQELSHTNPFSIVGSIHDAILFEIMKRHLKTMLPLIHSVMVDMEPARRMFGARIDVPIECDLTVGSHWKQGVEWHG